MIIDMEKTSERHSKVIRLANTLDFAAAACFLGFSADLFPGESVIYISFLTIVFE